MAIVETFGPSKFNNSFEIIKYISEEIEFVCSVSGYPSPDIRIYHNEKEVNKTKGFDLIYAIKETSSDDKGVYTCLAWNKYNTAKSALHISFFVKRKYCF